KIFNIEQKIEYENNSSSALSEIYLNDWANSFKDKTTPLARRFAEDYVRRFHFAREEEWGYTKIYSITNENVENFTWERPEGAPDIIKVVLKNPLFPGEKVSLNLLYQVKIPSEKFTRYGYDDLGNLKLKYWYITPAVFDEEWYLYSDKNLGDQYTPPANISIKLSTPPYLYVGTSLEVDSFKTENGYKTTYLSGEQKVNPTIYLTRSFRFESIEVNSKQIITNLEDDGLIFGM